MTSRLLHPYVMGSTLLALVFLGFAIQENEREQRRVGRYSIPDLQEPSGLVKSRHQPGVYWTHNDSGGASEIFATSLSGELLGRFSIRGAQARDWESITADGLGHLYLGDVGNNANTRRDLVVYKIPEPQVNSDASSGSVDVLSEYPFFYPEQESFPDLQRRNFDSEALFWATHPRTGQGTLYLLTKNRSDERTTLYRFDHLRSGEQQGLVKVGETQISSRDGAGLVTGAAISADERTLALLNYSYIHLFERPNSGDDYLSKPVHSIALDPRLARQAEAIAWDKDDLVFTNEQLDVFRISNPKSVSSAP